MLRAALLALLPLAAFALGVPEDRPFPTIKLPPGEQPVAISSYAVAATVRGVLAEVRATVRFRNPNGRQLEGELEFPLPDDAAVCGYALDIGGRLVDGVVVGRDQARVVLESERRQRIDPGLVEHVRGNVFRTRIFPLPAQGERTVQLTWVAPLAVRGTEAALRIPLPDVALPELALRVDAAGGEAVPELGGFGDLRLTRWEGRHAAEAVLRDVTPGEDLLVRLPALPRILGAVEDAGGQRFVTVSAIAPAAGDAVFAPRRFALVWDASGSRTPAAVARERAVVDALLSRVPDAIVDLVVLRDTVEPAITCRGRDAVLAALDRCVRDGGTALGRLDLSLPPHADDACWILVSDGLGTVGEGLPATGALPVHVLTAEPQRDLAALRLIAARTGGAVVDAALGVEAALAALRPPLRLRVEAPLGALADVQQVESGGRVAVHARLQAGAPVPLTLVWTEGGREVARETMTVDPAAALPGRVLSRAWAGARAADLAVFPLENAGALVALGRAWGVVTPGTSLLVLERLDQYLRHRIEPPASWPEMREQYLAVIKQQVERDQRWQGEWSTQLAQQWAQRVAWWEGREAVPAWKGGPAPGPVPSGVALPVAEPSAPATSAPVPRRETESLRRPADAMAAGAVDARSAAKPAAGGEPAAVAGAIAIQPFTPDAPWLRRLRAATGSAEAYLAYLAEQPAQRQSPSFYLDCAGILLPLDAALGRRVLSNLAELKLDDAGLLRVYAWRLLQAGDADEAVAVLRRVMRLRPEEPQSQRDLALALIERLRAQPGRTPVADARTAAALLWAVAMRRPPTATHLGEASVLAQAWNRFPGLEVTALEELNALLSWAQASGCGDVAPADLPAELRRTLDTDVRVVMAWDADATDIDLHVVQPDGEEAYYSRNRTRAGGLVSPDCTQGYGPEEYLLRRAPAGEYRIRCRYYGSQQQVLLGPATVVATVFLDWGRPTQRQQRLVLRLERPGEAIPVGAVTVGGATTSATEGAPVRRAAVQALRRGMDRAAVEAALGAPARVDGGGLTVLVYPLVEGGTVRIGFAPTLSWARETLDGAERELVR